MTHKGKFIVDVSDPQEPFIRLAGNWEQLSGESNTDCLMTEEGGALFPSFEEARDALITFAEEQRDYFTDMASEVKDLTYDDWYEERRIENGWTK